MAYQFQPAEEKDSQALLELMESQPAEGMIQLLYTRRPCPVASFRMDGEETSLGVIRRKADRGGRDDGNRENRRVNCGSGFGDGDPFDLGDSDGRGQEECISARAEAGQPVLMEASLFRPLFIGGEVRKAGYLCGLRKRQDVFLKGNALKLLFEYEGGKSDYCFCSILDDNQDVMRLLQKKRPYMPQLTPLCSYRTYMLSPRQLIKLSRKQRAAGPSAGLVQSGDLPQVYEFLAGYGKKHDFFPAVTCLEKQFPYLTLGDCVVVKENSRVIGFGALWDQRRYKQYIVKRYKGPMKLARQLSPVLELAGYVPVPGEGEVLPLAMLSLLAVEGQNQAVYELLLSCLAEEAQRREIPILVLGLPESNWQKETVDKIKSLHFDSRLYSMEWPGKSGIAAARAGSGRQLQVECGLL